MFALVGVLAPLVAAAPGGAKPARIVSLNLCSDQLVLMLADRAAIASVTFLALDPDMSYMAAAALGIPTNAGTAEEVLIHRPDLIVAGAFTTRETVAALTRLGAAVLELPVQDSLAEVQRQIAQVAAAVGEEARGAHLLSGMAAHANRLAARVAARTAPVPVAVVYRANGFTEGRGTLIDDMLRSAGVGNLATALGVHGLGHLPLARLISSAPDLLVIERYNPLRPSLSQAVVEHRALVRYAAVRDLPRIQIPARLMACGGPFLLEAAETIAHAAEAGR